MLPLGGRTPPNRGRSFLRALLIAAWVRTDWSKHCFQSFVSTERCSGIHSPSTWASSHSYRALHSSRLKADSADFSIFLSRSLFCGTLSTADTLFSLDSWSSQMWKLYWSLWVLLPCHTPSSGWAIGAVHLAAFLFTVFIVIPRLTPYFLLDFKIPMVC